MILIDTCSILKLKLLNEKFDNLTKKILENVKLSITHEVEDEVLYFYPEFKESIKKISILPKLNTKYYTIFSEDFDEADSTLLEYGKKKKFVIITEDPKMLKVSKLMSIPSTQLCDFLFKLNKEKKIFDLRTMRKVIKYLRKNKNITKGKYKKIKYKINDKVWNK